jgi:ParB/RepB/Spo0J family partition protein
VNPTIEAPLDRIRDNPWQTRPLDLEYVNELAANIKENGLLQAPLGRIVIPGRREVINPDEYGGVLAALQDEPTAVIENAIGHHRVAAFRLLDRATIPLQIGNYTDQQMAKMAWLENYKRRNLTPIQEARAIQKSMKDFGWNQKRVAEEFGLDRTTVSNKLRLLDLPEEGVNALDKGEMSERQATAVLPLYQLPPATLELLNDNQRKPHYVNGPASILKMAAGGRSSDGLRDEVARTIRQITIEFSKAKFPLDAAVGDGHEFIQSPCCTDCPARIKVDKEERCGDPRCFDTKSDQWRRSLLQKALEKFDLPVLPADADLWRTERFSYGNEQTAGAAIVEAGCPHKNLCLAYDPGRHSSSGLQVEGVPGAIIVCSKGESGRVCKCLSAWQKKNKGEDPSKKEEREVKARFKEQVMEPALAALTEKLLTGDFTAWRLVVAKLHRYELGGDTADWEPQKFVQRIADKALDGEAGHYWGDWKDLEKSAGKLDSFLEPAGIQPAYPGLVPADIRAICRRFDRVKTWCGRLHLEAPAVAAVKGNVTNLEKIQEDIRNLGTRANQALDTFGEAAGLLTLLDTILSVLAAGDLTSFEPISRLCYTPLGNDIFRRNLEDASAGAIRYALSLVRAGVAGKDDEDRQPRIAALEQRLEQLRPKTLLEVFTADEAVPA